MTSVPAGLFAGITAGAVTLVMAPIGGALSDRLGRKPIGWIFYILLAILIYPALPSHGD